MHSGGNGSTDQPVQRNVKGKKKKLVQKSSSGTGQGSQATHSKGNGDTESAGGLCLECVSCISVVDRICPSVKAADPCECFVLLTTCMPSVFWFAPYLLSGKAINVLDPWESCINIDMFTSSVHHICERQ